MKQLSCHRMNDGFTERSCRFIKKVEQWSNHSVDDQSQCARLASEGTRLGGLQLPLGLLEVKPW